MPKEEMIRLQYAASSNITFKGELETNIPVSEWQEMSKAEKDDFLAEELFVLVDLYVANEGMED